MRHAVADTYLANPEALLHHHPRLDRRGCTGDLPSLADFGLDKDIGGDHLARLPNLVGPGQVGCRAVLVVLAGGARWTSECNHDHRMAR